MKYLSTFSRGGIHISDHKTLTKDRPIRNAPMPSLALVPFSQHIGIPAKPIISIGDHVEETQLIGEPVGLISAAVHSPIPGNVREFKTIYLPNGIKSEAVLIELEGRFSSTGQISSRRNWESLSASELKEILRNSGVVGQGGATFPTHVKFTVPKGRNCDYFLINAAECEPYLSADYRLMLEQPEDIVEGIEIAKRLLKPSRIIIGIEANKPDAIKTLSEVGAPYGIEVAALKEKYPQGAEKNLIEALIRKEVPSGKLPTEVGAIIANIGTLVSICRAVRDEFPVIERVLTVSGAAIREPGNLRVRIGTSVRDIVQECGGFTEEPAKIISGGPMMGFAFMDMDTPITRGTSGILALTAREIPDSLQTACISCGRCVAACAMGLTPTQIFKNIEHNRLKEAVQAGLNDCVLCGACAYACPAGIPLVSAFRAARGRQRRLAEGA